MAAFEKVKETFHPNNSAFLPFLLALFLFFFDLIMGFDGFVLRNIFSSFSRVWPSLLQSGFTLSLGVAGIIVLLRLKGQEFKELLADYMFFAVFILLVVFFFILGGPIALVHVVGLLLIFHFMNFHDLKKEMAYTLLFCAIDFALYDLLAMWFRFNYIRYVLNLTLLFVAATGREYEQSKFLKFIFTLIIIVEIGAIIIFLVGGFGSLYLIQTRDPAEIVRGSLGFYKTVFGKLFQDFSQSMGSGLHWFSQLFNMSSYGPTQGDPEEVEPQGLSIRELDQGDRIFREGMKVEKTTMLEAKTLYKPIEVYVICYTELEDEYGEKVVQYGNINGYSGPVRFTIISHAQRTAICSFSSLPKGTYEIIINASFDFSSEITKRIYLMDRQRLTNDQINLQNKGSDSSSANVLRELYDIKDVNPTPIYTSGPVKLGIGTDNLPIDIGRGEIRQTLFSVSAENDWSRGGRIARFNSMYLKIPDTFVFSSLTESCDIQIMRTNEQSEQGYITYKVILDDRFSDVKNKMGVSCIVDMNSASLDPTPVTTRSLKSYIEYTYVMQQKINIDVKEGITTT
jgi:hypothetical protein